MAKNIKKKTVKTAPTIIKKTPKKTGWTGRFNRFKKWCWKHKKTTFFTSLILLIIVAAPIQFFLFLGKVFMALINFFKAIGIFAGGVFTGGGTLITTIGAIAGGVIKTIGWLIANWVLVISVLILIAGVVIGIKIYKNPPSGGIGNTNTSTVSKITNFLGKTKKIKSPSTTKAFKSEIARQFEAEVLDNFLPELDELLITTTGMVKSEIFSHATATEQELFNTPEGQVHLIEFLTHYNENVLVDGINSLLSEQQHAINGINANLNWGVLRRISLSKVATNIGSFQNLQTINGNSKIHQFYNKIVNFIKSNKMAIIIAAVVIAVVLAVCLLVPAIAPMVATLMASVGGIMGGIGNLLNRLGTIVSTAGGLTEVVKPINRLVA